MARRYQQSLLEDRRLSQAEEAIDAGDRTPAGRGDHAVVEGPGVEDVEDDDPALIGINFKRGLTPKGVRELARKYSVAAVRRLVWLMTNSSNHRVQLGAAQTLLDRAFGRAPQELKFSEPDNPEEIQRRRDAYEELSHRPEFLLATIEALNKAGVLSSGTPAVIAKAVEIEPEPKLVVVKDFPSQPTPPPVLNEEQRREAEEGQECGAERCRHARRSHPGGASCEACKCPMFVVEAEVAA